MVNLLHSSDFTECLRREKEKMSLEEFVASNFDHVALSEWSENWGTPQLPPCLWFVFSWTYRQHGLSPFSVSPLQSFHPVDVTWYLNQVSDCKDRQRRGWCTPLVGLGRLGNCRSQGGGIHDTRGTAGFCQHSGVECPPMIMITSQRMALIQPWMVVMVMTMVTMIVVMWCCFDGDDNGSEGDDGDLDVMVMMMVVMMVEMMMAMADDGGDGDADDHGVDDGDGNRCNILYLLPPGYWTTISWSSSIPTTVPGVVSVWKMNIKKKKMPMRVLSSESVFVNRHRNRRKYILRHFYANYQGMTANLSLTNSQTPPLIDEKLSGGGGGGVALREGRAVQRWGRGIWGSCEGICDDSCLLVSSGNWGMVWFPV